MRLLPFLSIVLLLAACRGRQDIPEVGHLPGEVEVRRFDKAFFNADTSLPVGDMLQTLQADYPDFTEGYLTRILGIDPGNERAAEALVAFRRSYRPVYESADSVWRIHEKDVVRDISLAIRLLQHYLPGYRPEQPFRLITFVGPMDAYEPFTIGDYGEVRTDNGVGLALQFHLGRAHDVYTGGMESGLFYDYQVRRFEPQTMSVNAVKTIIDDLFPYQSAGRPLVEEMVEMGKRMALLKRVMPATPDSLLLGYTAKQWEGSLANEAFIWQFFVRNDMLYSIEPSVNNTYLRDGPKTPELGEASPGRIGLFTGWRIVESWLQKQSEAGMRRLMQTPAEQIFRESGYKPR